MVSTMSIKMPCFFIKVSLDLENKLLPQRHGETIIATPFLYASVSAADFEIKRTSSFADAAKALAPS
jgi:hypothetical protein